nr:hypothetical protein CFP56_07408 [Quercus suber]
MANSYRIQNAIRSRARQYIHHEDVVNPNLRQMAMATPFEGCLRSTLVPEIHPRRDRNVTQFNSSQSSQSDPSVPIKLS